MREYEIHIDKAALTAGIAPYLTQQTPALAMVENLDVNPVGLCDLRSDLLYNASRSPLPYPFPFVTTCAGYAVAIGPDELLCEGRYNRSFPLFPGAVDASGISCADFGQYAVIAASGSTIIFDATQPGAIPTVTVRGTGDEEIPRLYTLCRVSAQILGVSVDRPNVVMWSRPGHVSFKLDHSRQAGYIVLPEFQRIIAIHALGEHVLVFGDNGVTVLHAVENYVTYGSAMFAPDNIPSMRAIACDGVRCAYLTKSGNLVVFSLGDFGKLVAQRVDIERFKLDPNAVSINVLRDRVLISDGVVTYTFSQYGIGRFNRGVSSLMTFNGGVVAVMHGAPLGTAWSLELSEFDFGKSAFNTLTALEIGGRWNGQTMCTVTSAISTDRAVPPVISPPIPLSPKGTCFPIRTGLSHKVRLYGTDRTDFTLNYIIVKFKLGDRHAQRGAHAATSNAR